MKRDKSRNEKPFGEAPEEVLKISSTGYGLESVAKREDYSKGKQQEKNPSSCGGL
ncbi:MULTISPECIES: hypothetical protein [unclassified Cytobacillus]|uniref:hypothetical protein n=1 Tax=unclassified Cytobacillus TaxID=2675268 RepID=UPI00135A37B0|nr:hypothetical protein [Cytobacillus sp. AMY 15.2]KAF0816724.1 hypothetical protein KIS4809_4506 [Bacillus sp. ZZV12-4809]MCM3091592.1 hypothetical protein [Cytobacillus sp. AMY 15.2]